MLASEMYRRNNEGNSPYNITKKQIIEKIGEYDIGKCYHIDCVNGFNTLPDNSVPLIVADPPFSIKHGKKKKANYNRKSEHVIEGYSEIDVVNYGEFSMQWITAATKKLTDNGVLIVVSGWSHQCDILNAQRANKLYFKNELIFKYNFGVFTEKKYVSSHYDIFIFTKHKSKYTYNKLVWYPEDVMECEEDGMEIEVYCIPREYRRGEIKNPNQLPEELVEMLIMNYSHPDDVIVDGFSGGGTFLKVATQLGRNAIAFEVNEEAVTLSNNRLQKYLQEKDLPKTYIPKEKREKHKKLLQSQDENESLLNF